MKWKTAGKIAVTLGLMLYLISKLDLRAIYEIVTQMDLGFLSFSLPLIVLMYLIKAKNWQILLNCIDVHIPLKRSLEIILMGTFFGALTPGRAGEISRAFYIDTEKSRSIPTVIMDRLTDIISLLILSVLSTALFFNDKNLIYLMTFVVPFFIAAMIFITNEKIITFVFKFFPQSEGHAENYIKTIREIARDKRTLLFVFALTFGYYFLNLIVYWIVIKSLSPTLNSILTLSLPIVIILGSIPISISGFGVREFASVTIFKMFNEDSAYGFSCPIVLYLLTSLSPALVGFLLTLKKKS
jgi:glycosyltransferase 2 family protein